MEMTPMEWWLILIIIFGGLLFLMMTGLPVAFCFLLICLAGTYLLWGGSSGIEQLILSLQNSVTSFILLPIPLFILMGDVMFHSGIAPKMISVLDQWLGRIPGRLSLLAVGSGTLLSVLTGTSMATVAILGSALVPEMDKKGYSREMSLGPILGSGGLAIMIPPSGLAVLVATLSEISVAKFLIAIIMPGLLLAVVCAGYIMVRCGFQPSLAPPYKVTQISLKNKLFDTVRYIFPIGIVIFLVIGVILLGLATPTEAAATGAIGCFILAAVYGKLNWPMVRNATRASLNSTGMMFLIIAGSTAFSQILAFSGASKGLVDMATSLTVSPLLIIIAMQIVVFILGMFLGAIPIIMICLPIFIPLVSAMDFNVMWFCVIFLMNLEISPITPPFGLSLFVMQAAVPDAKMGDIWRSSIPFIIAALFAMILVIFIPAIALWLPSVMA
jgi:tripartite ATP-independent transporter DctM subunit